MKSWFFRTSQKFLASSYVRLTVGQIQSADLLSRAVVLACIPIQISSEYLDDVSEDVLLRPLNCTAEELSAEFQRIERAQQIRKAHYTELMKFNNEGDLGDVSGFDAIWTYSSVALGVVGSSVGGGLTRKHNREIGEIWSSLNEACDYLDSAMVALETWEAKSPDFLSLEMNRVYPFLFHLANNKDRWKESVTKMASASFAYWKGH